MPETQSPSQLLPICLNLVAAGIGAFGQYFYKKGSALLTAIPVWKNVDLIVGCLLFCGVMVFFVASYRLGGKISVVYPFYATTFLWSTAIAVFLVGESVSAMQWAGVLAVVAGVAAIAAGQSAG